MEQENNTTTENQGSRRATELVRPLDGRVLAGVAKALANRYDIPLWVIRLLFIVTAFSGGLGIVLYAAGWALIRSEDEAEPPAQRFFANASGSRSWVGIVLIFVAALVLLDALTFVNGGIVWAVGLLVLGVLLYTGHIELPGITKGDDKEGVQQMTATEAPIADTQADSTSGDSPAGGDKPPTSTPAATPSRPRQRSGLGRLTVGLMLLGVGFLAVLDNIAAVPIDAEPRHYLALAVTILGVGLIVGSVLGRARWLILLGVVLIPTLLFSPVFESDFSSGNFNLTVEPQTFAELQESYDIDVGNLTIDLTELPWDGQTIEIVARVDAGNLEIRIPNNVGLIGTASVDVGRVSSNGRESSGLGNPTLEFDEAGTFGTVRLDAQVDVGNIEIDR